MSDTKSEDCGFCDKGTLTYRGKSQPCPYCGGTGKMATIDLSTTRDDKSKDSE